MIFKVFCSVVLCAHCSAMKISLQTLLIVVVALVMTAYYVELAATQTCSKQKSRIIIRVLDYKYIILTELVF